MDLEIESLDESCAELFRRLAALPQCAPLHYSETSGVLNTLSGVVVSYTPAQPKDGFKPAIGPAFYIGPKPGNAEGGSERQYMQPTDAKVVYRVFEAWQAQARSLGLTL